FLTETKLGSSAIQLAGDSTIGRRVCRIVAVEKIEANAADPRFPRAQPNPMAGKCDFEPQPFAVFIAQRSDRQLIGRVVRIELGLMAVGFDALAKVSLLIEQTDADHRHAEIARRLQLI